MPLFSDPSILSYFQGKHSALDLVLPRLKKKKKKTKKPFNPVRVCEPRKNQNPGLDKQHT